MLIKTAWINLSLIIFLINIQYLFLLYAHCSFSAVIGQIMVTWPPYEIDIRVQYYFPTFRLRAVRFMCSILNLISWKRNPTEVNWDKELRRVTIGLRLKSRLGLDYCKNTNYIIFTEDKKHFKITSTILGENKCFPLPLVLPSQHDPTGCEITAKRAGLRTKNNCCIEQRVSPI